MAFRSKFSLAAGIAAVAVIGVGVHSCTSAVYSAEKGEGYLLRRGFTDVSGGERAWIHTCGKDGFARKYNVRTADGRQTRQTVCFTVFGPYLPLI